MDNRSLFGRILAALGRLFAPGKKPSAPGEITAQGKTRFRDSRRRKEARFIDYKPRPLGPAFEVMGEGGQPKPEVRNPDSTSIPQCSSTSSLIRITQGGLAGSELRMVTEVTEDEAHVRLFRDEKEIGHCDIQRDAFEATVVLWNIVVQEDLRHKGLASIMTRVAFRKMLEIYPSASFAIRMIRLIKPKDATTRVQNIGIGVIARKLGFTSAFNLESILSLDNIQLVQLVSSQDGMPPAYRIVLKVFPLILVAFLVDQDTQRPFEAHHPLYAQPVGPEHVVQWVARRSIIIGNGNYLLRENGVEDMINHLATNELEVKNYNHKIRAVSQ